MNELAAVVLQVRPVGNIGFLVVVIALAHPQKCTGERQFCAIAEARGVHGPEVGIAGPVTAGDAVSVADMLVDAVILNDFAEVTEDFPGAGNRCADPGFETITEGIEIRIGTHTGILVRLPGTTEGVFLFKNKKALRRALLLEMVRRANPRYAGSDDQYVDMRGCFAVICCDLGGHGHLLLQFLHLLLCAGKNPGNSRGA